jgi:hypothetical protein
MHLLFSKPKDNVCCGGNMYVCKFWSQINNLGTFMGKDKRYAYQHEQTNLFHFSQLKIWIRSSKKSWSSYIQLNDFCFNTEGINCIGISDIVSTVLVTILLTSVHSIFRCDKFYCYVFAHDLLIWWILMKHAMHKIFYWA